MKVKIILDQLKSHKGQNQKLVYRKVLKCRKGIDHIVEKRVETVCRAGIDFERILKVQMERETGDRPETNQGLKYGEWSDFPYLIMHNNIPYVRIYKANMDFKPKTQYFLDGKETTKEEVESLCLASEFPKNKEPSIVFNIKASNIISIGDISLENMPL